MLRFVILTHDCPYLHWDFMLERDAALWTWRLDLAPSPGNLIQATKLPNHRLHYLEYEGEVSGGRGTVKRWDRGTYEVISDRDGGLVVKMSGMVLDGTAEITESSPGFTFRFTARNDSVESEQ